MQKLGKTWIVDTYVNSEGLLLHKTPSGYQFGFDHETQIITDIKQVEGFGEKVIGEVSIWFEQGGVQKAQKAKAQKELSEAASEQPGTLDALADKLGPEMKAQLFDLLKSATEKGVAIPQDETVKKVDGGLLISRPGQPKEFVMDKDIVDVDEGETTEDGSMAEAMAEAKEGNKRPVGRPVGSTKR